MQMDREIPQERELEAAEISRIIEMAWEDRTTFETIEQQFGLNEPGVIRLMRQQLQPSSFKMWRKRVKGRITKHRSLRDPDMAYDDRKVANHRRANC